MTDFPYIPPPAVDPQSPEEVQRRLRLQLSVEEVDEQQALKRYLDARDKATRTRAVLGIKDSDQPRRLNISPRARAIANALEAADRPMRLKEIHETMMSQFGELAGGINSTASALSRNPHLFKLVARGVYVINQGRWADPFDPNIPERTL